MSTGCREARKYLIAAPDRPGGEVAEHLLTCAACARFAARRDVARELFREHHGGFEPDAGFADRVAARLPSPGDAALTWAMARVLPATVALLAVLVWLSFQAPPAGDAATTESPTEDVLAWVLDPTGGER